MINIKNKMTLTTLIVVCYLVFLSDFTISIKTSIREIKIEYNGLLWVALDYWTIRKYQSSDQPMRTFKITHQLLER